MWYLNYCAPFMTNSQEININRYILGALLLVNFIIYFMMKCFTQCRSMTPSSQSANTIGPQ